MILLALSDFIKGKYNITDASTPNSTSNVTEAIASYEKPAIYELLGLALGNIVIAYLAASRTPTDADLDFIIDPFNYQNTNYFTNPILESQGLKEYLKACVFYQYNKNKLINTGVGAVNLKAETANVTTAAEGLRFAENKFNDILTTADAIQIYCQDKSTIYPTFAGKKITVKAAQFMI